MIAHILAAADAFKAGAQMLACRRGGDTGTRVARRKRRFDRAPTPRARQIETIEMHDIRIAAVADHCGSEQRCRLALCDAGQKYFFRITGWDGFEISHTW